MLQLPGTKERDIAHNGYSFAANAFPRNLRELNEVTAKQPSVMYWHGLIQPSGIKFTCICRQILV